MLASYPDSIAALAIRWVGTAERMVESDSAGTGHSHRDRSGYLMAAVSPDLSLNPPKTREAPFFHRLSRRIEEYSELARFNRPVGHGAPVAALWALWIAGDGQLIEGADRVCPGRSRDASSGCVINDFADRDIDPTSGARAIARSRRGASLLSRHWCSLQRSCGRALSRDLPRFAHHQARLHRAALTVSYPSLNVGSDATLYLEFRSVAGASRWRSRL